MNRHQPAMLYLFARWPAYGQGKSRLARETSGACAVRFQRDNLARLIRRLMPRRGQHGWRLQLALTREADCRRARHDLALAAPPITLQGAGDLGQRLDRFLARHRRRQPVLIIGSDIPDISAGDIRAALAALRRHRFVLGPASDGGFWLIGHDGSLPPGHLPALEPVRWSSAHAMADVAAILAPHGRVGSIVRHIDVDDRASLSAAWRARFARNRRFIGP